MPEPYRNVIIVDVIAVELFEPVLEFIEGLFEQIVFRHADAVANLEVENLVDCYLNGRRGRQLRQAELEEVVAAAAGQDSAFLAGNGVIVPLTADDGLEAADTVIA